MIIGGHSHTILEQPKKVNDVLIVQAGEGTKQIGRFDIVVDDDTNRIVNFDWQLVPINADNIEPDKDLEAYIKSYKDVVDEKYNSVICKLAMPVTHPNREIETSLGNLFADAMADWGELDVMLLGSGSIRTQSLGPLITLGDFMSCFPFTDALTRFTITGERLRHIFNYWMRPENRNGEGECYQVNAGVRVRYDENEHQLVSLRVNDEPVDPARLYTLGLQGFHASNSQANLDVTMDELQSAGRSRVVATRVQDLLLEYLREHQNLRVGVEGRLVYQA
jgi:5'-nucleotidase